jgi:stearoyl-CoA desaturase (Delta-9 desaturase)
LTQPDQAESNPVHPRHLAARRAANLLAVAIPFAGVVVAVVFLWNELVGPVDLALLLTFYVISGLGITVGYHRLLTHRSFKTSRAVRYAFAALGTLAIEGSAIQWVANHRKHHDFSDEPGDPHSPHEAGGGIRGTIKGLAHAHVGWLFGRSTQADRARYAADLMKDRGMRIVEKLQPALIAVSFLLPGLLGWLVTGTLRGGLTGLVWGGLVRVFILHHATFSINSICHFFGRRRFQTRDESRNVNWLAPLSFGESWHNNHHAFPTSASHGMRRREFDPGALFIRLLERLGLAWDVVRISPERQEASRAL